MKKNKNSDYIHMEVPFPVQVYKNRLDEVRKEMESRNLDVLIVFSAAVQFYLTGYQSKNTSSYRSLIIPLKDSPFLIVWQLEIPGVQLTSWLNNENLIGYPNNFQGVETTISILHKMGLENKNIGIEEDSVLFRDYNAITKGFSANYFNSSGLVREIMSIKSKGEIDFIRKAALITEKGMKAAINTIQEGVTDNDVAKEAYYAMVGAGSEYFSSQPFVTSGIRSGIPHTTFKRVKIKKGGSVLLEMSGVFNRYHAPMMRTVFVGEPTKRVYEMFNGCKIALEKILSVMAPGKTFDEVSKAGKGGISLIKDPIVWHKTYGYSIGIGFPPTWADNNDLRILEGDQRKLKTGMVFHHTMSVRDPGKYGVALSETTMVTESGCEVLTNFDRNLFQK